jgi:hypothetical protein
VVALEGDADDVVADAEGEEDLGHRGGEWAVASPTCTRHRTVRVDCMDS